MIVAELINKAQGEFKKINKAPVCGVIGMSKFEEGYLVLLEALEKSSIPDNRDILGVYELRLDTDGNLLDFERKRLRLRGETREE